MWSWAIDGTVDIPEANWSPGNEYDNMLWERLGENNDSIAPDSEELIQDTWTNSCKRVHRREPSFSSARMLESISSEIEQLTDPKIKRVMEDCSAEINNSNSSPPVLVDLETVASLRTQGCDGFSLGDETVQRQNKNAASQSVSQEHLRSFNRFDGRPAVDIIDMVKSGKDDSSLTSLDRLTLPDVSSSGVQEKLYEEDDDDDRDGTVNDYQWEQIGIMEDMENFLESSDSSVGEAGENKSYSLHWSSPLSPSTPATFISNPQTGETCSDLMRSQLNGELKLNGIASTNSTSAGVLETTGGSFRDRFLLNGAETHDGQFQPLTIEAEIHQQDYVPNQLSVGGDFIATTVPQANGLMLHDVAGALPSNIEAQGAQTLSFSGINKAQQMGGQPVKHMWSEEMRNMGFSPRSIQYLSLGETPRPADFALQHSLPVQQSQLRPLPLSTSIHEILPLPDVGGSLQAVLQQVPHFSEQLHLNSMPQLHPHALLTSPSSTTTQQVQLRQAYVDPYQHRHQPPLDKQQFNQQPSSLSDSQVRPPLSPVRSPLSGTNMTPQEKIEKLRWRQQIQAKLAVEAKKHQLSNISASVGYETFEIQHPAQDPRVAQLAHMVYNRQQSRHVVINSEEGTARPAAAHFLPRTSQDVKHNHAGIDGKECTSNTDLNFRGKESHLDTALFHQVERVIMQLDIGTRLSMRDALYRLASSAMQRRAVSDNSIGERGPSHMSSFAGASTLETPTNPIDRTIANLLFYKQPLSSPKTQVYPLSTTDARMPTSPSVSHSRLWPMQTPGTGAHLNWGIPMQAFALVSNGQNVDLSRNF